MNSRRVQIALVGAGAMGALHARVITQSQDADLACVVDPDRDGGELLAERFRTRWLPDVDDLSSFDAVIVASPTATHAAWGLRAIGAGTPVLIEKPLSTDVAETQRLVDEAERAGVPLMCGFLERFNPAVRTALDIVDEPVHVGAVRHSPYVPRIATGVAHDLLIHDVDLVLRMTGRLPDRLTANYLYCHPKSEPGAEDVAEVTLHYPGELLASLSASRVSQRKVRTLLIAELERVVEIDLVRQDLTVYRHVGNAPLEDDGPGYRQQTIIDIPTIQHQREPIASQLERFVALARGETDAESERASVLQPHLMIAEIARMAAATTGPTTAQAPGAGA
jgi:predicted dehydrogenase